MRVPPHQNTIVSEVFKGGTRGAPTMPRDVSLSNSKCWNGGHEWVNNKNYDGDVQSDSVAQGFGSLGVYLL